MLASRLLLHKLIENSTSTYLNIQAPFQRLTIACPEAMLIPFTRVNKALAHQAIVSLSFS